MRALLGLAVLLLLFASAAAWQGRLTRDLRRRQGHRRGAPEQVFQEPSAEAPGEATRKTLAAGWNTLIVGRPSGAEPFFVPEERARENRRAEAVGAGQARRDRAPDRAPAATPPPLPRFEPDFQITVGAGDVLSKICQGHYRTRPEGLSLHDVVGAVARYNDIASPDAIRVGDVIRLPDVARFVAAD